MDTIHHHATCLSTVRSSRSRAIKAHYLNLAAFWRLVGIHGTLPFPCSENDPHAYDLVMLAATSTFTRVQDVAAPLPA